MQPPSSTRKPRWPARAASSVSRRVLPTPASPATSAVVGCPSSARSSTLSRRASSSARPMKVGVVAVAISASIASGPDEANVSGPESGSGPLVVLFVLSRSTPIAPLPGGRRAQAGVPHQAAPLPAGLAAAPHQAVVVGLAEQFVDVLLDKQSAQVVKPVVHAALRRSFSHEIDDRAKAPPGT